MGDVYYAAAVAICDGVRFCVGAGSGKKLTSKKDWCGLGNFLDILIFLAIPLIKAGIIKAGRKIGGGQGGLRVLNRETGLWYFWVRAAAFFAKLKQGKERKIGTNAKYKIFYQW